MKAVYLKDKTGNKVVTVPYYRIGDLFLTTIETNPSSYLGGKWELFGPGRCLVCVDTSQSEFNSVKKIGGEKKHTLSIKEMPSHKHNTTWLFSYGENSAYGITWTNGNYQGPYTDALGAFHMDNTGGNQAHNNLQPFITCYVWIRTA